MALEAGARLGAYEIVAPIGAGGMGEVYKARDTRLDRLVAIKVLPAHLSDNSHLRERFEREARAVSSLNHPHICTLHDVGSENGVDFMVLEYIEGETLAERLKKGALPLEQAFRYAIEIADALDKAHRAGVVHRDLKPGNIMLTKAGAKLLDFGLAKQAGLEAGSVESAPPTAHKPLTQEGSILGTLQYMAPEQLEGKEANTRTDIFAFGAVLYEMLTGQRAFEGKSQASLIGAIMGTEPAPVSTVKPMSPPALDHVVRRCLAKDGDERWQSATDLMQELKWVAEAGSVSAVPVERSPVRTTRERLLWSGVVLALAGAAVWGLMRRSPSTSPPISRLVVNVPDGQRLTDSSFSFAPPMALSPDGTRLVYSATTGGQPQLYLRNLDQFDVEPIPGTEGGTSPFFSPDGHWLGFFAGGKLQKVSLSGGAAQTICDVPAFAGNGVTWGTDGTIIFAPTLGGLARVSAEGGDPETLTTPAFDKSEYAHSSPQTLPGGKNVLFTIWGSSPAIALLSLETHQWRTLVSLESDVNGVFYIRTGYIVYGRTGGLFAVRFDLERLRVKGSPVPILGGIHAVSYSARTSFTISETGSLVYEPDHVAQRSLVWVDREGKATPVTSERAPYLSPGISPDGRRLLSLSFVAPNQGIWVYDFDRETRTRVTTNFSSAPVWSTDGKRITFASRETGSFNLSSKSADGSGDLQVLLSRDRSQFPMSWSPDGKTLAYYDYGPTTGRDIWMLPLGGERKAFLATPSNEYQLRFSPDGRFVAYVSDESGQQEVYLQPYPGPGERTILSTDGGREPVWSRDGRELFYRNGDDMMVVSLTLTDKLTAGKPRRLFSGHYASDLLHDYDVSPDGKRFLMIREDEATARPQFHVVLNWFEELKRLVPTDN